ncbi:Phosphoserine phosphatase [Teratosphaeria destructans]|uniref:phosphoserine phosphatase n=1 Tax=Teratosphaeria destructans TaxID=418781 RepID=A0A9W7SMQ4_9PEZI|nr:Phosphoserine phosphatase [Teratosphaeria destructans]
MSSCELVVLVFAKLALTQHQWTDIIQRLQTDSLGTQFFGSKTQVQAGSATFLDPDRVLELRLTGDRKSVDLYECAEFSRCDAAFHDLQAQYQVEAILQPGRLYAAHKQPGLAVFDMDSTLIQQEVIDELARAVGLYDKVAAITEAAMRGEAPYTDFSQSLKARVALLKGVRTSVWDQLKNGTITFTPGAKDLAKVLKQLGWKTAVLSGGFTPLANWVKDTLGLDYAHANHLVADNDLSVLTGELVPGTAIVDGMKKQELLRQIAEDNNIPPERIIAVGDGSNDLPMMSAAGLGLAFNAKPKVQAQAPTRLNSSSLLDVMHVLGYDKEEVEALLSNSNRPWEL